MKISEIICKKEMKTLVDELLKKKLKMDEKIENIDLDGQDGLDGQD